MGRIIHLIKLNTIKKTIEIYSKCEYNKKIDAVKFTHILSVDKYINNIKTDNQQRCKKLPKYFVNTSVYNQIQSV